MTYTSIRKVAAEHANIPAFTGLVKCGKEPVSELVIVGLTRMKYVTISVATNLSTSMYLYNQFL